MIYMVELLEVVDGNNEVIRTDSRISIHGNLLRHRSVHLVMINDKGEVLLGKRSKYNE